LVGPAVVVLLYPALKEQRPADDAARRVEWSQWFVFCSVYALIVASGLENAGPLKLAAVLFLGALAYAFLQARNWDFAVAVLLVAARERARARGARARLLRHCVVRAVGCVGRDGVRDPHGMDQRGPRAVGARRRARLDARDARAAPRAEPAVGESFHRLAQG